MVTYRKSSNFVLPIWNTSPSNADRITSQDNCLWSSSLPLYSSSQKFGNTYSFKRFFFIFAIFYYFQLCSLLAVMPSPAFEGAPGCPALCTPTTIIMHTCFPRHAHQRFIELTWTHSPALITSPCICLFPTLFQRFCIIVVVSFRFPHVLTPFLFCHFHVPASHLHIRFLPT